MIKEAFNPLFRLVFICMWLTAATELGPGQWITNIYNDVMTDKIGSEAEAGVLLLVWGSGLMWFLRQFGGNFVHKVSPISLIGCTAPFAAVGLWLCSQASSPLAWFIATGLLYFGFCFWWPAMLGIASERFPRTGALGLALMGGAGSFSTFLSGPTMGWINDTFGADRVLAIWAIAPIAVFIIFTIIDVADHTLKHGFRGEALGGDADA